VRIYNHALPADQILALFNLGRDVVVAAETQVGDVWQAFVIPFSTDEVGPIAPSNTLTIADEAAPIITSAPVTEAFVGFTYKYDVEATGHPAPQFELTISPEGMNIDPATGLITWIPQPEQEGLHPTQVRAWNLTGEDFQDFEINVAMQQPCPEGITHLWDLDEIAGSPYRDSVGASGAVCADDCPSSTAGIVGGAQWFDGGNDELDVPDDDTFDWNHDGSFSVVYWMKTSESTSTVWAIVGRDDSTTDLHWWVGADNNGRARFQCKDNGGSGVYIGGTGPAVNDDIWHFIVAVRDANVGKNLIYVDGEQVDEATHTYGSSFASDVPLNLGYLNMGSHYRYKGALDEVALYDRVLLPDEIRQQYLNGLQGYGYCTPFAPVIISEAPTTATYQELYTYDCEAAGHPAPIYTLTQAPEDMSIDPLTGVIEWTPTSLLDPSVTITVTNSEGTAEQSFNIHIEGPTGIDAEIPSQYFLADNFPNPFNPSTTIRFGLPAAGHVEINIFDIAGQKVNSLVNNPFPAGAHEVVWTGRDDRGNLLASGIYFYRLRAGYFSANGKMMLIK
jgi:hypothetical protein